MDITRRDALKAMAGSAALAALPRVRAEETKPMTDSPAPAQSTGSFRHSACRWCYQQIPLDDLAREGKRVGLESIELLEPAEWPVVQKHGLTCAMAMGVTRIPEGLNRIEHHAVMVPGMVERIKACADAGLPNVICFSGNRGGMDDELGLANCAVALKQIVGEAEKRRVTVCMELLNSRVNHPDYMCDHTAWGVELVKRVGSERFKLLYDIYHMQIMEGDVIRTIRENHSYIAHYHTGGVPGRHEIDGTQELNYPAIARAIKEVGHRGFVAQEFIPVRDPITSLAEAILLCTV
ncbi:MAG: TIM barrel protein [Opitutaceae bacterium]|jgi:hydroxypyruvate isomerase